MTQVLLIGFDPAAISGQGRTDVAPAFEHARDRAAQEGIILTECLLRPDDSAIERVQSALTGASWDCVVVGGGIRKPAAALEFFEHVVNLVHLAAPRAAIAESFLPVPVGALLAIAGTSDSLSGALDYACRSHRIERHRPVNG